MFFESLLLTKSFDQNKKNNDTYKKIITSPKTGILEIKKRQTSKHLKNHSYKVTLRTERKETREPTNSTFLLLLMCN